MPRRLRSACRQNAGKIMFLRHEAHIPCICILTPQQQLYDSSGSLLVAPNSPPRWRWLPFNQLDAENFMTYREKITEYLTALQGNIRSIVRSNNNLEKMIVYQPSMMERAFLRQIFNNHLSDDEKRRYIVEYSNTIVGEGTCYKCLNIAKKKRKCLHYDCPGMCKFCYDKMDDKCPACEKEQTIVCPVCLELKSADELCHHESKVEFVHCGHPICWGCLGKSFAFGKAITKCPLCRANWISENVLPVD